MRKLQFGVLGAGVIGLTTAIELQKTFRNAEVTIIAEKFNEETTSDGAAGIFRPGTSFLVENEDLTRKIISDSYEYYDQIRVTAESSQTGVSEVSGYIFSNTGPSVVRNHLIEKVVPVYRSATQDELTLCPGTWSHGAYFSTVLTECRKFLPWAMERFQTNEGRVIKQKITSLSDLANFQMDVIVNCLGMGAQQVCQDHQLVPIRGQVLKVKAPWLKHFFYGDYDTYIIPGQDLVTLGGCRNYDSYDLAPSRHDRAAILERCTALVPRLAECAIEREWVGLRPHRYTVRLEREIVTTPSGNRVKVVHNYGHGGYGVTAAPGSAKRAVELVHELVASTSKL